MNYYAGCVEDDEFEEWVRGITVQEIILSSYFDVADYKQPVHYFLDDMWVPMEP